MKTKTSLPFLKAMLTACMMLAAFFANAQTNNSTVFKEWFLIGESTDHLDVSARIVKCNENEKTQIHLMVFNEGAEDKEASFTITVTNPANGAVASFEIKVSVAKASILQSQCEETTLNNLKITLPDGFDASSAEVGISFH